MPQLKVDSEDIPLPKEQVVKKRKLPFGHFKIFTKRHTVNTNSVRFVNDTFYIWVAYYF